MPENSKWDLIRALKW